MNELFLSPAAGRFGRKLKRERGARHPGHRGDRLPRAGKTTLLKRFLATPEGQGTAVVVNEFGTTGIDDALIRSSATRPCCSAMVACAASRAAICNKHCAAWWWSASAARSPTSVAS